MKKIFLIICVLIGIYGYSQPGYNLINSKYNWLSGAFSALNVPAGATPALTTGQYVRSGALYYDSTGADSGLYVSHGLYWVKLASGNQGSVTSTGSGYPIGWTGTNFIKSIRDSTYWRCDTLISGTIHCYIDTAALFTVVRSTIVPLANNGLSVSGATVQLGGSDLSKYTAIGLNGFPLNIVHNGVNNANQSDSNSLRFVNNTIPTGAADSMVSPAITFQVSAKPLFAAAQIMKFRMSSVAGGGSTTGSATLRIRSSTNNGAYGDIFNITQAGVLGGVTGGNIDVGNTNIGRANSSNIRFGSAALNYNNNSSITGSLNTAIGDVALGGLLVGKENTAVGYHALSANDSDFNTAVGNYALNANTKGFSNAAFGKNALLNNTTGSKNSAIGAGVMENNTTGSFNSGNGHDALLNNTTGSFNSANGYLALSGNLTGSGNVGVGNQAGRSLVNGDNNIFIGGGAGYLNGQEDTVTNSIAIGRDAATTVSNQIVIGNSSHTDTRIWGLSSGLVAKRVLYDPATAKLYYADTSAGGGGGSSSLTVGTTTIASGTTTRLLYDNAGVLGEYTTVPVANGGTNIASYAVGDLIYASASAVLSKLPDVAAGSYLRSGGVTTAPLWSTLILPNSATAGYIPYATATNTWGEDAGLTYNGTTNSFVVTGPASSLTNGPKHKLMFDADANAAVSWFTYAHENMALTFDSWFDGTNWISSNSVSNFALYKTGGGISWQINSGTAPGSSFAFAKSWELLAATGDINQQYGKYTIGSITTGPEKLNVYGNIQVGVAGTTIGKILQSGNTSGTITIQPQAAAGTYNFNLPITAGTAGQVLTSQAGGSTAMTWTTPLAAASWETTLNTQGATAMVSNHTVDFGGKFFYLSNVKLFQVDATDQAYFNTTVGAGVAVPTSQLQTTSFSTGYVAKTGNYTLTIADHTVEVTTGTNTQTLPSAVGITGREYVITNSGTGVVTVGTTSSQTFVNVTATPTTLTLNQFNTVIVQSNGANWLRISSL